MKTETPSLLSSASVGLAIFGAVAAPETLLQVVGPLLALAIHVWTERTKARATAASAVEIAELRAENRLLRSLVPPPIPALRLMPSVETSENRS